MASAVVQHPRSSGHHSLRAKQGRETRCEERDPGVAWGTAGVLVGTSGCGRWGPVCCAPAHPETQRGPGVGKNRGQGGLRREGAPVEETDS